MTDRESLRSELDSVAATQDQREALESNPQRGLAAIREARRRGATNVASYAVSVFNSTFSPKTNEQAVGTNRHASVNCHTCGGDRMVVYELRGPYEEYAPCPDCNADCDTTRFGYRSPDPARVRERLNA